MKFYFYYTDSLKETHKISFRNWEYPSLMLLIFDNGLEDWGDCKGRAWCGTCHIKIQKGVLKEPIDREERHTLALQENVTMNSRLACQIPITESIHQAHFCFVDETES